MLPAMTLGEKIAAARLARAGVAKPDRAMTQRDVGQFMGVESNTVARWEAGRTVPSLEDRIKLAGFLGAARDAFLLPHELEAITPDPVESRVERDDTQLAPLGALEELEQVMEFLKVAPAYRQRIRDVRWQGGIPLSRGLLTQMVGELVAGYRGEEERAAGFARPKGGPQGQEITFPDEDG